MRYLEKEDSLILEELFVIELFQLCVEKLFEKFGKNRFNLDEPFSVEIANDSDHHRTRIGTMNYQDLVVISIENRNWIISQGLKSGAYPGEEFTGDIIAVELFSETENNDEIAQYFCKHAGCYFRNSLVIGASFGDLGSNESGYFGTKVQDFCYSIDRDIIANESKINPNYISLNLIPIFDRKTTYKPKAVEVLAESILLTLKTINPKIH